MKKTLLILAIFLLVPVTFFAHPAYCGDNASLDWHGTELQFSLKGKIELGQRWAIELSWLNLRNFSAETSSDYFYFGGKYRLMGNDSAYFMIGLRCGGAMGLYKSDAGLVSWTADYTYSNIVNFSADGEVYFNDKQLLDYYGIYSLSYSFFIGSSDAAVFFGAALEHVDYEGWAGPKLGVCFNDRASAEIQYWYFPKEYAQGIRVSFTYGL